MAKYFLRVGIAISVLLNVILGGYSNQTFSARNYDWKKRGRPNLVFLIDGIFNLVAFLSNIVLTHILKSDKKVSFKNHCMSSWTYWITRKNMENT